MKKIIGGKRYDTETAKEMGSYQYLYRNDFHWFAETLYRKSTGEYFLYGEGGPASRYSRSVGQNEWTGGERIIPLTVEAAQKWAEENLDGDDYESIFGPVEEADNKRTVSFSLPESVIAKIKNGAAEQGMSLSDYVAMCIEKA